jgi:hypothetical protein
MQQLLAAGSRGGAVQHRSSLSLTGHLGDHGRSDVGRGAGTAGAYFETAHREPSMHASDWATRDVLDGIGTWHDDHPSGPHRGVPSSRSQAEVSGLPAKHAAALAGGLRPLPVQKFGSS